VGVHVWLCVARRGLPKPTPPGCEAPPLIYKNFSPDTPQNSDHRIQTILLL